MAPRPNGAKSTVLTAADIERVGRNFGILMFINLIVDIRNMHYLTSSVGMYIVLFIIRQNVCTVCGNLYIRIVAVIGLTRSNLLSIRPSPGRPLERYVSRPR